jgi:molybdopterin/thiamine biosynthesis adenylyltransferase
VTLIGAGGIGAITGLTLAKMGVGMIEVWDDDEVSEENLATQLHKVSDIGKHKVIALREMLREFADDVVIYPERVRVTANTGISGQVVISAVDSIQARKDIWAALEGRFEWYIDARMGAEIAQVFCVHRDNTAWYEDMLNGQDDSSIPDEVCTRKATFFAATGISGILGSLVRKICTGQELPHVINFDFTTFTSTVI